MIVPRGTALGDVPRETQDKLDVFVRLLQQWNRRINLVAETAPDAVWARHVHDSLQLAALLPRVDRAADLGSGAGFPGLILAIASGVHFHLIEADRRKAAFLAEAARETRAPVTVHACRIEACPITPVPLVTARALAPLTRLLWYATPLLAPGGLALFPKGRNVDAEITEAGEEGWKFAHTRYASESGDGVVLALSELNRG